MLDYVRVYAHNFRTIVKRTLAYVILYVTRVHIIMRTHLLFYMSISYSNYYKNYDFVSLV